VIKQTDPRHSISVVTHALAQEGHRWGRKAVTMPLSAVTGAGGSIRLNIIKRHVRDRRWLASTTQTR
jgi:hypothetical protein